jgi:hypothetical protein
MADEMQSAFLPAEGRQESKVCGGCVDEVFCVSLIISNDHLNRMELSSLDRPGYWNGG